MIDRPRSTLIRRCSVAAILLAAGPSLSLVRAVDADNPVLTIAIWIRPGGWMLLAAGVLAVRTVALAPDRLRRS